MILLLWLEVAAAASVVPYMPDLHTMVWEGWGSDREGGADPLYALVRRRSGGVGIDGFLPETTISSDFGGDRLKRNEPVKSDQGLSRTKRL